MTIVRFHPLDGGLNPLGGDSSPGYYEIGPLRRYTTADGTVHDEPFQVQLTGAPVEHEVPPTPAGNATVIREVFPGGGSRTVLVPNSPTVIKYEALVDLDVKTLEEIVAQGVAPWVTGVAGLAGQVRAADLAAALLAPTAAAGLFTIAGTQARAVTVDGNGDLPPLVASPLGQQLVKTPDPATGRGVLAAAPLTEAIWIPAKAFDPVNGTGPSWASLNNQVWGWLLGDETVGVKEGTVALLTVPAHWASVNVEVWWMPLTTAGGNTRWEFNLYNFAEGEALTVNGAGNSGANNSAAGAIAFRPKSYFHDIAMAVYPAKITRLAVFRNGTSSLDTVAGDVGFLGVKLKRAS